MLESPRSWIERAALRPLTAAARAMVRVQRFVWLALIAVGLVPEALAQELRFPKPEFQTGYDFPRTTVPEPASMAREWIDVGVLFVALSIASWLAVKKRSRKGIFALMTFSLIYFGFVKQGCVCPIGAIQNVAFSLVNPNYAVPMTVLAIFLLPLIFAIVFGRVFCSSVCALGAIQDMMLLYPVKVPRRIKHLLEAGPYAYLGIGVLLAATGTGFIICRYDPFIGIFRLTGETPYLLLGGAFLLTGMFVGRPYCRFLCPYGVLLGWLSRFSKWHLSITPSACVQCRLCEESCPFDHIDIPNEGLEREERQTGVKRLGKLVVALPLFLLACGWIGNQIAVPLSSYNDTIELAERVVAERQDPTLERNQRTEAYGEKGMAEEELFARAARIRKQMSIGGWLFGAFMGLVIGLKLMRMSIVRNQRDYEVNKPTCFSCARCCPTCPSDDLHKINFLPTPTAPTTSPAAPAAATEHELADAGTAT